MDIFHMHISKYSLHWSMVRDIFSVCVTFIMEVVVKKERQRRFCKTSRWLFLYIWPFIQTNLLLSSSQASNKRRLCPSPTACFFVLLFNALLLNALDFTNPSPPRFIWDPRVSR